MHARRRPRDVGQDCFKVDGQLDGATGTATEVTVGSM